MELVFRAFGRPSPQGSKKSIGNNRFIEASKYLPAWREALKIAALASAPAEPFQGTLELDVTFYLQKPKTVKRTAPTVPPDLDKLVRSLDSLTGIIWVDDAQVCDLVARKRYTNENHLEGAVIMVRQITIT